MTCTKRIAISKKTRFEVFERDNFTCRYCGRRPPLVALHIDHFIPVSKGGTNDLENLVTACADCNLSKHDKILSYSVLDGYAPPQFVNERDKQLGDILEALENVYSLEGRNLSSFNDIRDKCDGHVSTSEDVKTIEKLAKTRESIMRLRKCLFGIFSFCYTTGARDENKEMIEAVKCFTELLGGDGDG